MNTLITYLPYLPLIVALAGASLAFYFGRKHTNYVDFQNKAKESLEDLLEPMYFHLKEIIHMEDEKTREVRIKEWLDRYQPCETPIHKLGDKDLIKKYLSIYEHSQSLKKRDISKDDYNRELNALYYYLEKQYWTIFNSLYKDYYWYNHSANKILPIRLFLGINRFIRNVSQVFMFVTGLILVYQLYFKSLKYIGFGDYLLFSSEVMSVNLSLLSLSVTVFLFCTIFDPEKRYEFGTMIEWIVKLIVDFIKRFGKMLINHK